MNDKELEIIKIAKEYGLKAKWINDVLYVKSSIDEWIVDKNECNRIILKHQNRDFQKYPNHNHIQKVYRQDEGYRCVFDDIATHDSYKFNKHKYNRMSNLFDMVASGDIPKMKLS